MSITRKKICILPRKLGLGGPASFQSSLIQTLNEREIGVVHDPLDPAVSAILVIGGTQRMGEVIRAQRTGVRVVQRLNGMNWVHRRKFTGIRHFLKSEYGNMRLSSDSAEGRPHCLPKRVFPQLVGSVCMESCLYPSL